MFRGNIKVLGISTIDTVNSQTRFYTLDSLRGIAALQVVIGHCFISIPSLLWMVYKQNEISPHNIQFYLAYSPLHFFVSGTPAVKVFFVLSGFVLSLPYLENSSRASSYTKFFVKRILRLYLPCLAIISISLLLKFLLFQPHKIDNFTEWLSIVWRINLNRDVIVQLLLLNNYLKYFNSALWTLPVEIKLSLILPMFAYLQKRFNILGVIISLLLYALIWHILKKFNVDNLWKDFLTLYYFTFFLIGLGMCKYRMEIIKWIDSLAAPLYLGFVVTSVVIYTSTYTFWWLPKKILLPLEKLEDYLAGLSSIMFITIALSKRAEYFLTFKPLLFLGKISFSLYLTHIVVFSSFAYLFNEYLNMYSIIILAFISSFPCAFVFYKCVELPSIKIAKIISNRVSKYRPLHVMR